MNQFVMFAIFLVSFTVILSLGYLYLKKRLINIMVVNERFRKRLKIFLIVMIYSPLFTMPLRFLENHLSDGLLWYSFISLGIVNFVLILVLLRDIILFFDFSFRKIKIKINTQKSKHPNHKQAGQINAISSNALSRKDFFMNAAHKTVFALSSGLAAYGIYEARKTANIVKIKVALKKLPPEFNNFKITQITDIHIGPTIKRDYIQNIVQAVNYTKPDVIAITGDLVDGTVEGLYHHAEPLKNLQSIYGTYFVTGNHEYYSDALEWIEACKKLNMKVLLNENVKITKNRASFYLAGVTDYTAHRLIPEHKTNPTKAAAGCEPDSCKILLAHQPKSIFEASKVGYDLQISGHTHGGQIFPWNFLVSLVQPYTRGLHLHKNTWIYVNKGTGYWGPPMRVGATSEITEIILKSV